MQKVHEVQQGVPVRGGLWDNYLGIAPWNIGKYGYPFVTKDNIQVYITQKGAIWYAPENCIYGSKICANRQKGENASSSFIVYGKKMAACFGEKIGIEKTS